MLVVDLQAVHLVRQVPGGLGQWLLSATQVLADRRAGDLCEGAGEADLLHPQGCWPGDSDHVQCQVRLKKGMGQTGLLSIACLTSRRSHSASIVKQAR